MPSAHGSIPGGRRSATGCASRVRSPDQEIECLALTHLTAQNHPLVVGTARGRCIDRVHRVLRLILLEESRTLEKGSSALLFSPCRTTCDKMSQLAVVSAKLE
jgi:hypothetical protein